MIGIDTVLLHVSCFSTAADVACLWSLFILLPRITSDIAAIYVCV